MSALCRISHSGDKYQKLQPYRPMKYGNMKYELHKFEIKRQNNSILAILWHNNMFCEH